MEEQSVTFSWPSEPPMQVGIVLLGDWRKSRKALEYLILLLNTKQDMFEYQVVSVEGDLEVRLLAKLEGAQESYELLKCMLTARRIKVAKEELSDLMQTVSVDLGVQLLHDSTVFNPNQVPKHFIYICTSEHEDEFFFHHDGVNGFHPDDPYHGALILVGSHNEELYPPTIVE